MVDTAGTTSETLSPAYIEWRRRLVTKLGHSFDLSDLGDLCFDLGIDFDDIRKGTKQSSATSLVSYAERRGMIWRLVRRCVERRENISWEYPPPTQTDIEEFLGAMTGLSIRTQEAYRIALRHFLDAKIAVDENALKALDEHLFRQKYVKGGTKHEYSKAARQLYTAALRRFLRWLDSEDKLPPWTLTKAESRLKVARGQQSRSGIRRRIPDDRLYEMITFYDGLSDPVGRDADRLRLELYRNRAVLHCLWDSAARVSELLSLTRAQVSDGQVDRVVIMGKGQKERYIFFTRESQAAIRAYCRLREDPYPGLFISHRRDKGAKLSRISAWNIVKRASRGSGLTGMVSPHMIRHARASQLVNEGMPMESVQLVLGHESIATTQTYYAKLKVDVVKGQLDEYGLSPGEIRKSREPKNPQP